jgi:7-carboxy-7-deazaguanine synthase
VINIQPIEKLNRANGDVLDVHSIFKTIQGEGPFSGRAAVFIRLAGCNLQCPGCDTEYTQGRINQDVSLIVEQVQHLLPVLSIEYYPRQHRVAPLVVVTGGEPFRQDLHKLVTTLIRNGYTVQIETNGTLPPRRGELDYLQHDFRMERACFIVCSPKTNNINKALRPMVAAYKYVMDSRSVGPDGLPLLALGNGTTPYIARPPVGFRGPIYLQPCDDKNPVQNAENLEVCIESVLANSAYTLQLQTHKLIEME